MRCVRHRLAAGPDGLCVVCLRDARENAQRRARWLSALFFGAVLAVCGVLLAARTLRPPVAAEPPAYVTTLNAARPTAPTPTATQPQAENLEPPPAASSAGTEPANGAAPSAPPAPASGVAEVAPAPSARVPTQQEVQAAVRATPVQMFSTSWCPVCTRARQFFHANGIGFVDHDVDHDPAASAELQRRSGGKAIPLIEVDGRQLRVGFSEQDTMQAVASSVERRLGVTGLHLVPQSAPN